MAYEKQTFSNGQVLTAEHLNHMESGIKTANDSIVPDVSAEVYDIRIGYNGTKYNTAGEAVRGQFEGLEKCIRPYEWSLNSSRTGDGKLWPTIMDLPSNQFYKFITDVPESFGLPVTGLNGTLVVFDCSNSTQTWYRLYLCSVLLGDGTSDLYVAYANPNAGVSGLTWDKVAKDEGVDLEALLEQTKKQTLTQVDGLVMGVDRPKIVLLGDSIMAGVGSSDYDASGDLVISKTYSGNTHTIYRNVGGKGWGQRLKAYLESTYPGCSVVNNAWPGVTTWMLSDSMAELVPEDADIAIVQVGTNSRTQSDKTTKIIEPMRTIIQYLKNKGIVPVIMTNTVLRNQTAPNDEHNVRQCIMASCREEGVYCYDVLGEMEHYLFDHDMAASEVLADNLHPNDAGHEVIYNLYRKLLRV